MKQCGRCGVEKPIFEFAWKHKTKGWRKSCCKACLRANGKSHYEANKPAYLARSGERTRILRWERAVLLAEYFKSHPCVDCGKTDRMVLEFDHLRDKSFTISTQLAYRSGQSILEEIGKCEVVCANCHRRRTARRAGSLRALPASAP